MLINKTKFRTAKKSELAAIRDLQAQAFGQPDEGNLVEKLVNSDSDTYSLVAEYNGALIGHILYTDLSSEIRAVQLAPLGVHSDFRDFQIGSELVRRGNQLMSRKGYDAIFVLGDKNFYGRFGFNSQLADRYQSPFQSSHFMAKELNEVPASRKKLKLSYPAAFMD